MAVAGMQPSAAASRWHAALALEFRAGGSRSYLSRCRHVGPLRVQRPFYEPEGTCQVYLVHPPGGVVGGDTLQVDVHAHRGAQALITTPGATKFYRTAGALAEQRQVLRIDAQACVEWLPQEVIVFDGARAKLTTRVEVAEGGSVALWEIVSLGRPSSGEPLASGEYRQRTELYSGGRPVFIEQQAYAGGAEILEQPWGLSGRPVTATLVVFPVQPGAVEALRGIEDRLGNGRFSATATRHAVVCRYLGDSTAYAREVLARAWAVLRPRLFGKAARAPRIWAT